MASVPSRSDSLTVPVPPHSGRCGALSETAAAYAHQALSPATRRAYGSHLRAWEAWCRRHDLPSAPARPSLVANHLAELAGRRAHSTLTGRLAAIVRVHRMLDLPFDAADPGLRATLAGIARRHGTSPHRQAAPLLVADLRRLADACGGDLRGERDRSLLLLGFAGAFRRSELATIAMADLRWCDWGLEVYLPRAKDDQHGRGRVVAIAAAPAGAGICPVAALRRWLAVSGLCQGPLFRAISRHGAMRAAALSGEAVRDILQHRAWEAGYRGADLARLTPHSLRAGCITTLARAQVHERDIMTHSRHSSQTVMRGYIRQAGATPIAAALWRGDAGDGSR
jgi:integrase